MVLKELGNTVIIVTLLYVTVAEVARSVLDQTYMYFIPNSNKISIPLSVESISCFIFFSGEMDNVCILSGTYGFFTSHSMVV